MFIGDCLITNVIMEKMESYWKFFTVYYFSVIFSLQWRMLVFTYLCIKDCNYFLVLLIRPCIWFSFFFGTFCSSSFDTILLEYMYLPWEVSYHFKYFYLIGSLFKLFSLLFRSIAKLCPMWMYSYCSATYS